MIGLIGIGGMGERERRAAKGNGGKDLACFFEVVHGLSMSVEQGMVTNADTCS